MRAQPKREVAAERKHPDEQRRTAMQPTDGGGQDERHEQRRGHERQMPPPMNVRPDLARHLVQILNARVDPWLGSPALPQPDRPIEGKNLDEAGERHPIDEAVRVLKVEPGSHQQPKDHDRAQEESEHASARTPQAREAAIRSVQPAQSSHMEMLRTMKSACQTSVCRRSKARGA